MADIYVAIRNQDGRILPSVNGEFIMILVTRNNQVIGAKAATLDSAMARFQNLASGSYTVIVRHPDLSPTEARTDAELADNFILGLRYIYDEPTRRLSQVVTEITELP